MLLASASTKQSWLGRRFSGLSSYAAVLVAVAVLVGLGVYIGRELVRPERRPWEGEAAHCSCMRCSLHTDRSADQHCAQALTCQGSRGTSRRCGRCRRRCAATSGGRATPALRARGTSGRTTTCTTPAGVHASLEQAAALLSATPPGRAPAMHARAQVPRHLPEPQQPGVPVLRGPRGRGDAAVLPLPQRQPALHLPARLHHDRPRPHPALHALGAQGGRPGACAPSGILHAAWPDHAFMHRCCTGASQRSTPTRPRRWPCTRR